MDGYNNKMRKNWHDLISNGLVILSMISSLLLFGSVFILDHQPQIYAFSNRADNLATQVSLQIYALSNQVSDLFVRVHSDYQTQIYALSAGLNNLSAQVYSAFSEHQKNYLTERPRLLRTPLIYNRPSVRFNYSAGQFNKIFDQLKFFSQL